MEHEVIHIEQMIDNWRLGQISKEELFVMLQASGVENPEEAIQEHDAAVFAIQHFAIMQQVKQAQTDFIQKANKQSAKGTLVTMRKYGWLAAAVMVGIIFFSGGLYMQNSITSNTLAADLNQEYLVAIARGNDQITDMAEAFSRNDLEGVIRIYETGRYHTQRDHFLAGYAYMQRGSLQQAISLFKSIEELNAGTKEKLYQDEADYYLMLAYLESERNEEAYQAAQKIYADSYHTYRDKLSGWKRFQLWWLKP